ncbi:hypothetical protein CALVIDRAFT_47733 [Calocera viscosa TUFC12733]|uniref:Uncharacterized protein n=1 Tax=Calocera viscosa (strain TUFC12733) TaxID=1330018 RepID=A0A167FJJ7_CALVF|nr:hypothetical protein CALVIDRAFT_47733 [Calocera viscosa TUFC12733]
MRWSPVHISRLRPLGQPRLRALIVLLEVVIELRADFPKILDKVLAPPTVISCLAEHATAGRCIHQSRSQLRVYAGIVAGREHLCSLAHFARPWALGAPIQVTPTSMERSTSFPSSFSPTKPPLTARRLLIRQLPLPTPSSPLSPPTPPAPVSARPPAPAQARAPPASTLRQVPIRHDFPAHNNFSHTTITTTTPTRAMDATIAQLVLLSSRLTRNQAICLLAALAALAAVLAIDGKTDVGIRIAQVGKNTGKIITAAYKWSSAEDFKNFVMLVTEVAQGAEQLSETAVQLFELLENMGLVPTRAGRAGGAAGTGQIEQARTP